MAKLSKKKILAKQYQAKVSRLTNKECSKQILYSLKEDLCLSSQIGIAISLVLQGITENQYTNTQAFEEFIKSICRTIQRSLNDVFARDLEQEYPVVAIAAPVLQIIVHAELVKGIYTPLIPTVEKGKLSVKASIEPTGIKITDNGREFLKAFNASKSIFAASRDSIATCSDLAIECTQKIADKYQDQ